MIWLRCATLTFSFTKVLGIADWNALCLELLWHGYAAFDDASHVDIFLAPVFRTAKHAMDRQGFDGICSTPCKRAGPANTNMKPKQQGKKGPSISTRMQHTYPWKWLTVTDSSAPVCRLWNNRCTQGTCTNESWRHQNHSKSILSEGILTTTGKVEQHKPYWQNMAKPKVGGASWQIVSKNHETCFPLETLVFAAVVFLARKCHNNSLWKIMRNNSSQILTFFLPGRSLTLGHKCLQVANAKKQTERDSQHKSMVCRCPLLLGGGGPTCRFIAMFRGGRTQKVAKKKHRKP